MSASMVPSSNTAVAAKATRDVVFVGGARAREGHAAVVQVDANERKLVLAGDEGGDRVSLVWDLKRGHDHGRRFGGWGCF